MKLTCARCGLESKDAPEPRDKLIAPRPTVGSGILLGWIQLAASGQPQLQSVLCPDCSLDFMRWLHPHPSITVVDDGPQPSARRRAVTIRPERWQADTVELQPGQLSAEELAWLAKAYVDWIKMYPGRVVVLQLGRRSDGELALRSSVTYPDQRLAWE